MYNSSRISSATCHSLLALGFEWGASSVGRARRSQRRGRGFDPPALHQTTLRVSRRLIGRSPPNCRRRRKPSSGLCFLVFLDLIHEFYGFSLDFILFLSFSSIIDVSPACYGLQMVWIYARGIATCVVNLPVLGKWCSHCVG